MQPPPLEIREYFVDALAVQRNPSYKDGNAHDGTLLVDFDIRKAPDAPEFLITMTVDVNKDEAAFRKAPYRIGLAVSGYFGFPKGTDEEIIQKMIGPNGLSILYGIARGTVAQATACSRHGKFILPAVNFIELLREKAQRVATSSKKPRKPKK
jgi:preprotein translocase subunit SecB